MSDELKSKLIYNSIVLSIFIFLAISVFSLKGHSGYSSGFINFYLPLLLIGAGLIIVFGIIFATIKKIGEVEILNFADPNDPEEYRVLGDEDTPLIVRALPSILFGIIISVFILTVPALAKGFYLLPEVSASGEVSKIAENYFISFPVGISEDFIFQFVLPMLLIALLIMILKLFDVEITKAKFFSLSLVVCLLTSAGYGAIMPGFASTHEVSFKDDTPKYLYVFGIGYVQSVINVNTGLFLPIAHVANNWFVNDNYQGKVIGSVAP
jgi:hypothetical protein